jgi:hypothetical protein
MRPLYEDLCFTFRFADDRIISRFHLDDIQAGGVWMSTATVIQVSITAMNW